MKGKFIAAALVAGMASPAAASTVLDFTSSSINTPGSLAGSAAGANYTISGSGGLTNATHDNNVGCTGLGWDFACDADGSSFDVGFGVSGGNPNEVDGINNEEWVQVAFDSVVRVLGFAGMLTYDDSSATSGGIEQVELQYSSDGGGTWASVFANAIFDDSDDGLGGEDGNDTFSTVGLAFENGLSIFADVVRFRAAGTSPFDDGNANITAAGLEVGVVPVPAALPLLLAGMGALGWVARRKTRKAA